MGTKKNMVKIKYLKKEERQTTTHKIQKNEKINNNVSQKCADFIKIA